MEKLNRLKNIIACIGYEFVKKIVRYPSVYSIEETLNHILISNCSVTRYGDGEIKWIYNLKQNSFQNNNDSMSRKLKEILVKRRTNRNVIICIPEFFNGVSQFNNSASLYYKKHLLKDGKFWRRLLDYHCKYYNADITRPYIDYKDKDRSENIFGTWKKIFKDRNILMVEGGNTRFGVGNDLLNDAKSVKRIICPSQNAFNKYTNIKESIIEASKSINDPLVLIALGPTATILSYDLSEYNLQAIDIGHTDLEYEWYLRRSVYKEPIKGKVVNELGEKPSESLDFKDQKFNREIIKKIL